MTVGLRFAPADLDDPQVAALVASHRSEALANSPPGRAFALDAGGLRDPLVALFGAWAADELVGMGALRTLGPDHMELKSMRTLAGRQRQGVGQAMLDHLLAEARARGATRISLETGGNEPFAAARRLYERNGFTRCPPFGDYTESAFNLCYSLAL